MSILTPWLESLAVASMALLAFLLGRWFSRLPRPYWAIGYVIPLAVVLLYCVAIFEPRVAASPPISWMTMGRSRFVCFNLIAMLLLSVPLAQLPQRRTRTAVRLLILVLTCLSLLPFLAPAFNRAYLAGLKTRIDGDGVCHQSNDYTCGPAAAVTVLRKLGFPAEEGELAILAHANSITGTEPDVLASVLQKRYGAEGFVAEYRGFKSLEDLKQAGLSVAVLEFNALQDHCVAILGIETNQVIVGDPLSGLSLLPKDEFEKKWQFAAIALKRASATNAPTPNQK